MARRGKGAAQRLSHLDRRGRAQMVDVGAKAVTERVAVAEAWVRMRPATRRAIYDGSAAKGDVLAVARVAGILGAKRTAELIPLCHSLALTKVSLEFEKRGRDLLRIRSCAQCWERTGVEMEALVAASVAALTIYDMLKAVDRGMVIEGVRLLEKMGGKSGHWVVEAGERARGGRERATGSAGAGQLRRQGRAV